jgi:surfactin synthase thioesterase subunit
MKRKIISLAAVLFIGACAAVIDESSMLPALPAPATTEVLRAPDGYVLSEEMIDLGALGKVHAVRLDNPNTVDVVIINGGSAHFTQRASRGFARIAHMSGSDIIAYDYPGRGGTTLLANVDVLIAMGPELVSAFRRIGWLSNGQNYVYGFSYGGSNASNMARAGGFNGLILDSTTSDTIALGRNMAPKAVRPFVRLKIDGDLSRFDYFNYAVSARIPILLLSAEQDELATPRIMSDFARKLRAAGADVTTSTSQGGHGRAIYGDETLVALREFMAKTKK